MKKMQSEIIEINNNGDDKNGWTKRKDDRRCME